MEVGQLLGYFANPLALKKQNSELKNEIEDAEKRELAIKNELLAQVTALHSSAIVSEADVQGNISFVNDAFLQFSKYNKEELFGKNHRMFKSGHQSDELFKQMWASISSGHSWQGVLKNKAKDGSFYWVKANIIPVQGADGKPVKYIGVRYDITDQIEMQESLKANERTLQQNYEEILAQEEELRANLEELDHKNHHLGVMHIELTGLMSAVNNACIVSEADLMGNITYANDFFVKVSKYDRSELMGQNHRILKSDEHGPEVFENMWRTISSGKFWTGVVKNRCKDGSHYWVRAAITPVLGYDGKPMKYISVRTDISNEIHAEQSLNKQIKQMERLNAELENSRTNLAVMVETKTQELHDSVVYAQRMQRAILPDGKQLAKKLPSNYEAGIFFMPKDGISGDFYWVGNWKNKTVLAMGDGTGHGVPGAFMSLLGISTIKKLVEERGLAEPASLLDEMDNEMRSLLNQESDDFEIIQDSIELSVATISADRPTLTIGCAMRNALLMRGQEQIEIKADRRPVGGTLHGKGYFSQQTLEMTPGDTLFLYSDGILSQMGGPLAEPKKFGTTAFKSLIKDISAMPSLDNQVKGLYNAWKDWKGYLNDQTDDIIVVILRHKG